MSPFPWIEKIRRQKIDFIAKWDIEPHEILLDSLAKRKEEEMDFPEQKIEVPLLRKILQGLFFFSVFLIFILLAKSFQLQVLQAKHFSELSLKNKFIVNKLEAARGVIYDQNLNQLVYNQPSFDLVFKKDEFPAIKEEEERILSEISEITGVSQEEIKKRMEKESSLVLISENVPHEQLIILEAKKKDLQGFEVKENMIRSYPEGEYFAHVIGYTGKIKSEEIAENPDTYSLLDYVGREGIEKTYEEFLKKNPGKVMIERDAKGNELSSQIAELPQSGNSLVLWLDAELQKKSKEVLEKRLSVINSKKAVVIAMDPNTGGILSMISLPSFDNNLFQKGGDSKALSNLLKDSSGLQPLLNRAIAGKYLTGSVIKPLIAAAVLEEEVISPEKKINCLGQIEIPNQWDPEMVTIKKDWEAHGPTDLRKALAESCSVYFYVVGGGYENQKGLGPTKIKEYLSLFGWDGLTGIDLPGEKKGFVPDQEWKKGYFSSKESQIWYDGDTYNLSIGQGYLQITPLEVAASMAAIANGGTLYQPQVVQKIVDGSAVNLKTVQEMDPKVIRENFIDPEILEIVREGMRHGVTGEGAPQASSLILNSLPVSVAAKTGTAQLGNDYYDTWITAFAPYENPKIVLTVLIEDVKGLSQLTVLPVAKDILEWYFTEGVGGAFAQ